MAKRPAVVGAGVCATQKKRILLHNSNSSVVNLLPFPTKKRTSSIYATSAEYSMSRREDEDVERDVFELQSLAESSDHDSDGSDSTSGPRSRSSLNSEIFDFEDQNLPAVPLSASAARETGSLKKLVTFRNGLGLVIGLQIGSGIFSTPGLVAQVGSPGASIMVWIAAGLLAWTGASSYAELGASLPFNGGSHAYLQHIYGDLAAFLFSWTGIIALKPGSGAIISIICAEYIMDVIYTALSVESDAPRWLTKIVALLCAALVSVVVGWSTKAATRINDLFTFTKILTLITITLIGFVWLGLGNGTDVYQHNPFSGSSINGGTYALALYSGLWAFDGWDNCSYVANEMTNPGRDIPRVVHTAQPIVIIAYVLANLSYFAVLPLEDIQKTHAVALDFGNAIAGSIGGLLFALAVICSSIGALLSSTFTTARLVAVSGEQNELPKLFGKLHPRTNTPLNAIMLQFSFMVIYIAVGDFEHLVTFYGVSAWIFFFATVLGLVILRYRQPELIRPYKTWLGTPIIFCCVALFLIVRGVFESPIDSGLGIAFIVLGVPAYYIRFGISTGHLRIPHGILRLSQNMRDQFRRPNSRTYRNI